MKKNTSIFLTLITCFMFGQNKQIVFETGNFASVLEKAAKENKPVFVDAFTTWCGPCKKMSKDVFTTDSVANYFNKNFINYKFDMEKGEGIEFAKKYQIQCYPNLLVLDSKGTILHRGAGFMKPSEFIEFAKASFSSDDNFIGKKNYFEKTVLNEKTIMSYISLMEGACLDPLESVTKYLLSVKDEELSNKTNWGLLRDYINDINSKQIKYLINNYKEFELKYNYEVVNKISKLGLIYFSDFLNAKEFDKVAFEKSKQDFLKLNWPYSEKIIFNTELKLYKRFNKTEYFITASKPEFLTYNINNAPVLNSMAWTFYEEVKDKDQLAAAIKMAMQACELEAAYAHLDTYAAVLYKAGKHAEAEIQALKAIEAAKKENIPAEEYNETSELLKKIKAKQ